jgi:isopenicillin-N N-acyltransferase-like protein
MTQPTACTGVAEFRGRIYGDIAEKDCIGVAMIDEDFRSAFFDDWGSPRSVCRPPRPNNRGNPVATAAMILMRPGEGHLEAYPMPALNRRFATYTLTPDQTAQRQAAAE